MPLFYEEIVRDPTYWVKKVFEFLGHSDWVLNKDEKILLQSKDSSRTASKERKRGSGGRPAVDRETLDKAYKILREFKAENIYDLGSGQPRDLMVFN